METNMNGFYVSDEFRTNPKSLIPGGWDLEVGYHNGDIRLYSNIKYPEMYATKVLANPEIKYVEVLKESFVVETKNNK